MAKVLIIGNGFSSQLHIEAMWLSKVNELASKHGMVMVHDEIIFDDEVKAAAFRKDLEHWWQGVRGGHNVGTHVSAVQGTTQETGPKAGDL